MAAKYGPSNPVAKGVAFEIQICLKDNANPGSFKAAPTIAASGDFKCSGSSAAGSPGALTDMTVLPVVDPAGSIWVNVQFSASEMNFDQVFFQGIDQTNPKEWADIAFSINTCSVTRGQAGTALPAAAADAAGGLAISDAGGLDLDAKIGALTFTTANKVDATVPNTQKVDVETIKTRGVTAAGAVVVGGFVGQDTAAIGVNASGHVSRVVLTDTATALGAAYDAAKTAATQTSLNALVTTVGVAGAGLTAIDLPDQTMNITGNITGNLSGSVGSVTTVSDKTGYALTSAYDPAKTAATQASVDDLPTNAELATSQAAADDATLAAIAALNNLSAAQVNAEVDTALADYDGPTHAELTSELATADDATLAAIAALNNPSASAIAAAVRDVDNGTPAAGSLGEAVRGADAKAADIQITLGAAGAGLTAADDAVMAAIAALNDFDPTTEEVIANVKKVNDIDIDGTGTSGDPWGPV